MNISSQTLNGVATIEIARPAKRNALTLAMYEALRHALNTATADDSVRAVLITGQGGAFTSGNDLEDFLQRTAAELKPPIVGFLQALLDCDKPVIAAVDGPAVGIGATMLLHCDLVYLSDSARLIFPFVPLGLVPEFASSLLLPLRIGYARAAQVLLLGEPITAAGAVELGIANAVLPPGEVLPRARATAERFNALPSGAVRESKKLMRAGLKEAVSSAISTETEMFLQRLGSPEARAAMDALLHKRRGQ